MHAASKKTPKDATEFEREQLRFFLTKSDAAAVLAEVNPSLAWLPMLAELKGTSKNSIFHRRRRSNRAYCLDHIALKRTLSFVLFVLLSPSASRG